MSVLRVTRAIWLSLSDLEGGGRRPISSAYELIAKIGYRPEPALE